MTKLKLTMAEIFLLHFDETLEDTQNGIACPLSEPDFEETQ